MHDNSFVSYSPLYHCLYNFSILMNFISGEKMCVGFNILVMFILSVNLFFNFIFKCIKSYTDSYNKHYKYKIIGIHSFRHNNIRSHEITSS